MALTAPTDQSVDPLLQDPEGIHAAAIAAAPEPSPALRARLGAILKAGAR